MIKQFNSILCGKIAGKLSRIIGHKGSSLPGTVAYKIDPNILKKLSEQVKNIIFVTGTNGKTTTCNILAHLLRTSGRKVINNFEGSNMFSGIASCFINNASLIGNLNFDYAILEIDENSLPRIMKHITPHSIIITNFFRDQLDRYGEIDTLIHKISLAIQSTSVQLILNADDPFVCRLNSLNKNSVFFGLNKGAFDFGDYSTSESKFCLCGEKLFYDDIHYNQLGIYQCKCGFERPTPQYEIDTIHTKPLTFSLKNQTYRTNLTGAFNVYNALAAVTCATELGIQTENIKEYLHFFRSDNGRMQTFNFKGYPYTINLHKNPAGTSASLSEILATDDEKQVVFFINDAFNDGVDVSWIWDIDFKCLQRDDIKRIICSGNRTWDMLLRLKYAGIHQNKLFKIQSIESAVEFAFSEPMNTYFLPTYSALQPVIESVRRRV